MRFVIADPGDSRRKDLRRYQPLNHLLESTYPKRPWSRGPDETNAFGCPLDLIFDGTPTRRVARPEMARRGLRAAVNPHPARLRQGSVAEIEADMAEQLARVREMERNGELEPIPEVSAASQ